MRERLRGCRIASAPALRGSAQRRGPVDQNWYIAVIEEDGSVYLPQDLREYLEIVPGDVIDLVVQDEHGRDFEV